MLDYLSILKMHYLQELSFREIGASVDCGKTAVGRFITRFEESELTFLNLQEQNTSLQPGVQSFSIPIHQDLIRLL